MFVIVPQVPDFSPVVINSNFKSLDVLDAIYFSYGLSGSIGTQVPVAPGTIGFHDITEAVPVARFILTPVTPTVCPILTTTLPTDISISAPPGNILAEADIPIVPVLTFTLFPV